MPGMPGLMLQQTLSERGIDWPTVVLSGHGDIDACRRAFQNGTIDFLGKPVDELDLIEAIQKGHRKLDQRHRHTSETVEARRLLSQLTDREAEILEMIAKGPTTRQIAQTLGLSSGTVDIHRAAIRAKSGTTSPYRRHPCGRHWRWRPPSGDIDTTCARAVLDAIGAE